MFFGLGFFCLLENKQIQKDLNLFPYVPPVEMPVLSKQLSPNGSKTCSSLKLNPHRHLKLKKMRASVAGLFLLFSLAIWLTG